jgi:hypothetical protein
MGLWTEKAHTSIDVGTAEMRALATMLLQAADEADGAGGAP